MGNVSNVTVGTRYTSTGERYRPLGIRVHYLTSFLSVLDRTQTLTVKYLI